MVTDFSQHPSPPGVVSIAMRRGRRLCVCIGAATAAAIILLACASLAESGAATARMAALKRPDSAAAPTTGFSGSRISFRYPAGWQAESDPEDVSNFWALVVYLSNQPLHPPCAITIDSKTCGPPLSRLSKGSILAVWSEDAFPGWTFKRARGMPLRVGGHRAKLRLTRSACGVGLRRCSMSSSIAPTRQTTGLSSAHDEAWNREP